MLKLLLAVDPIELFYGSQFSKYRVYLVFEEGVFHVF
jgi:hypothetical protein